MPLLLLILKMRSFNFDPLGRAPIVSALIVGPKGTRKVRLILDTGAEMTQLHTARMAEVGYTQATASVKASWVDFLSVIWNSGKPASFSPHIPDFLSSK